MFTGQEKVRGAFHGYSELKERGWIKLALPKCLNCNLSLLRNTPVQQSGANVLVAAHQITRPQNRSKTLFTRLTFTNTMIQRGVSSWKGGLSKFPNENVQISIPPPKKSALDTQNLYLNANEKLKKKQKNALLSRSRIKRNHTNG